MVRVRDEECQRCQALKDDTAGCGAHGGHTHSAPGEIREGELHWQAGWFFERMFDGTVKIRVATGWGQHATAMIPAEQWDAIHAHVRGATGEEEPMAENEAVNESEEQEQPEPHEAEQDSKPQADGDEGNGEQGE